MWETCLHLAFDGEKKSEEKEGKLESWEEKKRQH